MNLSLFELENTAPAESTRRRHFYRCLDCLAIVATTETAPAGAQCGGCMGKLEYMGETRAGLYLERIDGYRPACDDRCTHAMGPNCECSCGGVNHGSGKVVPIVVHESIPRLGSPDAQSTARAEYYAELCASIRHAWRAQFGRLEDSKTLGNHLPPECFRRLLAGYRLNDEFKHARGIKTYSARTKALLKVLQAIESI